MDHKRLISNTKKNKNYSKVLNGVLHLLSLYYAIFRLYEWMLPVEGTSDDPTGSNRASIKKWTSHRKINEKKICFAYFELKKQHLNNFCKILFFIYVIETRGYPTVSEFSQFK